jgi:sulfite exporter TauE/SafE
MTPPLELLAVAFIIGLGSSGHCLLMCGGISSALTSRMSTTSTLSRLLHLLLFHTGRISCYALLGTLLGGTLGWLISYSTQLATFSRIIAALTIIFMGLYVSGYSSLIRIVEKRLAFIWQNLQPLTQRFMAMQHWYHAFCLGLLWGFLPCGMIYSTLLWASSNNQGFSTGLLMLSFGLGTVPALLATNWLGLQTFAFLNQKNYKRVIGLVLIAYGLISMAFLFMPASLHNHHHKTSPNDIPMNHQHHH